MRRSSPAISQNPGWECFRLLNYYLWYGYALKQIGQVKKAEQIWDQGCKKHPDLADFINQF